MNGVSGVYERVSSNNFPFSQETLRLDVDGHFPQMALSGAGVAGLRSRVHWVCQNLTATENENEWTGEISFRSGSRFMLPHTRVTARVRGSELTAVFSGGGAPSTTRVFAFRTAAYREVALEYDFEEGVEATLSYDTHAHPDRPGDLPEETLTIDEVFRRAGFRVTRTGGDSAVPTKEAGLDSQWTDAELHDAMQTHFSQLANLPANERDAAAWRLWTFFGKLHIDGVGLGGIMFDRIGAAERRGTALFTESLIAHAPAGDPAPDAWVQRMTFWTAIHEMGHAFNLSHAWEKHLGSPWIPQPSNFDLQTFMNYPARYQTGPLGNRDANVINFFRDFRFRFTDDELLFLRHAPESFVQMGGEDFGQNHAFEQARIAPAQNWSLQVRTHREKAVFEFMEPIRVELKLKNVSNQLLLATDDILSNEHLTVVVQRQGGQPRALHSYTHVYRRAEQQAIPSGQAVYESLFLSADSDGWLIDQPGYYSIRVCLHLEHEDVVSEPLTIRVAPPKTWDEEYLAQDFFTDEPARATAFQGTRFLTAANNTLTEIAERLDGSNAALHARAALAMPCIKPFKLLSLGKGKERYRVHVLPAEEETAASLAQLLGEGAPDRALQMAEVFGNIPFRQMAESCGTALHQAGKNKLAASVCERMGAALKKRDVLPEALDEINSLAKQFSQSSGGETPKRRSGGSRRRQK